MEKNSLYLIKTTFHLKAEEQMLLPSNKSSMFRGGFGHIFKRFNCANKSAKTCLGCLLKETCIYNYIFEEKKDIFSIRPYIIETTFNDKRSFAKGETIQFNLILLGKATKYLPHFILTFIELGKIGITANKHKFSLDKVIDSDGTPLYEKDSLLTAPKVIKEENFPPLPNRITLDFYTPLRLTRYGDLVVAPTAEMILTALLRRINSFAKDHCGLYENINAEELSLKAKEIKIMDSNLVWKDWTRYSNRQHAKMEFGGLLGSVVLEGNLEPFSKILILGQYLHIGKNCTFGNGAYKIKEIL